MSQPGTAFPVKYDSMGVSPVVGQAAFWIRARPLVTAAKNVSSASAWAQTA